MAASARFPGGARCMAGRPLPRRLEKDGFPVSSITAGRYLRGLASRRHTGGARWKGVAHQARAERLDQFLTELMQSDFMNILRQYGVGRGEFVGRSVLADASSLPDVLTDGDIQRLIQEQITRGLWPEPTSGEANALLLYLDEDINTGAANSPHSPLWNPMDDPNEDSHGDCAFGYHSVFRTQTGNPFPYAVLPAVTDVCVRRLCSADAACSLHLARTQEQRQTQTTSHAFAEITTNPLLNAWFDPDPAVGEIGDICNGESATLVLGANHWTVQRLYSKSHDTQTEGATFCASEAPLPLPCLLSNA